MRTLLLILAVVIFQGCASREALRARNDKELLVAQEAQEQKSGLGASQWFYVGTAGRAHHLVFRHKTNDGRSTDFRTEVPTSKVTIPDPFPVTFDETRWRQIESPAR